MRLITWNCNSSPQITSPATAARVFAAKTGYLQNLHPDVAVLQEVAQPSVADTEIVSWFGGIIGRGIGVVAGADYTLEPYPRDPTVRSVLPVRIRGPVSFNLLAVWSRPEKASPRNYMRELWYGLDRYAALLNDGPTMVMGDFNSNTIWDHQMSAENHSALVRHLERYGLVSSYHRFYQLGQGEETHPTFYMYRQLDKSFHIDYCFVPATWTIQKVTVGTYEDWRERSDHCPLIADVQTDG